MTQSLELVPSLARAITLAGGITLGAFLKRAIGLHGLDGPTVQQCDDWRKAAAWITPNLSDTERAAAAQNYNMLCRNSVAATATTAAAAIAAGEGNTAIEEVNPYTTQPTRFTAAQQASREAAEWLRNHPQPAPADFRPYVKPAPTCGPLDGACIVCGADVLAFNSARMENARRAYQRAKEEYDCWRNKDAGHPERCNVGPTPIPEPNEPQCTDSPVVQVIASGGQWSVPSAAWVQGQPEVFVYQSAAAAIPATPVQASTPPTPQSGPAATASTAVVSAQTPTPTNTAAVVAGPGIYAEFPSFNLSLPTLPAITLPEPIQDVVNSLPVPEAVKSNAAWIGIAIVAAAVLMGGKR